MEPWQIMLDGEDALCSARQVGKRGSNKICIFAWAPRFEQRPLHRYVQDTLLENLALFTLSLPVRSLVEYRWRAWLSKATLAQH